MAHNSSICSSIASPTKTTARTPEPVASRRASANTLPIWVLPPAAIDPGHQAAPTWRFGDPTARHGIHRCRGNRRDGYRGRRWRWLRGTYRPAGNRPYPRSAAGSASASSAKISRPLASGDAARALAIKAAISAAVDRVAGTASDALRSGADCSAATSSSVGSPDIRPLGSLPEPAMDPAHQPNPNANNMQGFYDGKRPKPSGPALSS